MEPDLVRSTLRALLLPRRLVPILVVCIALVAAQGSFSTDPLAIPLAVSMCVAFVLVAPLSWRVLFPTEPSLGQGVVRLFLFIAIAGGTVLVLGTVLPRVIGMGRTFLTAPPSLLVSAALFVVGGWGLGRDIGLEQRLDAERARAAVLSAEVERAQLLALRSHLDPHFLFNTLNAIAEWCRQDGQVAERAVLELSAMLRTILSGVRASTWPLQQELALLETLFSLHLLRDPELFQLRMEVAPGVGAVSVPPLLLLPLAENAVKHGPARGHRGELIVSVERSGPEVSIRLSNPGPWSGPREGGQGLPTVERRLALAYGKQARLQMQGDAARTVAHVVVPAAGPLEGVSV